MSLDPQVVDFLAALETAALPRYVDLDAPDARDLFRELALRRRGDMPGDPVGAVFREEAGGIPVRIYVPAEEPRGVLVLLHGGGWVIGDLDTHDPQARALCHHAGVVVVSVDYRLAPEHPFPAAVEDAVAATRWVAEHNDQWSLGPLAVGGDSAGGNLAAVVAQQLRDEVPLAAQLLIYPFIDLTMEQPSVRKLARGYYLEADTMRWFRAHYLGGQVDPRDARVSPLFADDLGGLPPAVIATAEFDPLRDEGRAYADALRGAGVEVRFREHPGQIHGFFGMGGLVDSAEKAIAATCADLAALLDTASHTDPALTTT